LGVVYVVEAEEDIEEDRRLAQSIGKPLVERGDIVGIGNDRVDLGGQFLHVNRCQLEQRLRQIEAGLFRRRCRRIGGIHDRGYSKGVFFFVAIALDIGHVEEMRSRVIRDIVFHDRVGVGLGRDRIGHANRVRRKEAECVGFIPRPKRIGMHSIHRILD
jgi:hypothetical protein